SRGEGAGAGAVARARDKCLARARSACDPGWAIPDGGRPDDGRDARISRSLAGSRMVMLEHRIFAGHLILALGLGVSPPATSGAPPNEDRPARPDAFAHEGLSPADAAAAMTVPDGFSVKLFAGEPDVVQPIAFTFDDRGRLWVVEAYSYPVRVAD